MNSSKSYRCVSCFLILFLLFLFHAAAAETLKVPEDTRTIDAEAFYGDEALDEVVLPYGIDKIGERAFARSGIRRINLPGSLTGIADDAFEQCGSLQYFFAERGSYAWNWLVERGYEGLLLDRPEGNDLPEAEILDPAEDYEAEVEEYLKVRIYQSAEARDIRLEVVDTYGIPFPEEDMTMLDDGCVLHLKKPGFYLIYLYSGETLLDETRFCVKDPSYNTFYVQSGSKYYQYVYNLPGTPLAFHVKYDFMPTSVVLYQGTEERMRLDNSYRYWEFVLEDEIGLCPEDMEKGYGCYDYTVRAFYGNETETESVTTAPITVYCLMENPHKGEYWSLRNTNEQVNIYRRPDGRDLFGGIGNAGAFILGDYAFGNYCETRCEGIKGFINLTEMTACGTRQYNLTISSDLEGPGKVRLLQLDDETLAQYYHFRIVVPEDIDMATIYVSAILPDRYQAGSQSNEVTYAMIGCSDTVDEPHVLKAEGLITDPGMYAFHLRIHVKDTDEWLDYDMGEYEEYLTFIEMESAKLCYVQKDDLFLSGTPLMQDRTMTVELNTQVVEHGSAGGDIVYVSVQGENEQPVYGFMHASDLDVSENPSVRRALVFVSSDLILEKEDSDPDKWEYQRKTVLTGAATYKEAKAFFQRHGCEIVQQAGLQGACRFDRMIANVMNGNTDDNDETYIYICAHGVESPNSPVNGRIVPAHAMKFDFKVYLNDVFLLNLSKVRGKVVVILDSCLSETVITDAEKQGSDVANKINNYTFLASAEEDEEAPAGSMFFLEPLPFTASLIEYVDGNPTVTASQIKNAIPVNQKGDYISHTTIGGNTGVPFFSPR